MSADQVLEEARSRVQRQEDKRGDLVCRGSVESRCGLSGSDRSCVKLLCDEAVEGQIVQRLRDDGHEVLYVEEMSSGISDDEILQLSKKREAVLVTPDKDFGELVFRLERASLRLKHGAGLQLIS